MEICTIRDVARRAGVAVNTVSRVLNGKPDVSEATRRRVLDVVEECGFVQNGHARFLKQDQSEFAMIIVRGRHSMFLGDAAERMLAFAQGKKTPFIVKYIDEEDDEFDTMRQCYAQKRAGGFVFLAARRYARWAFPACSRRWTHLCGTLPTPQASASTTGRPRAR